MLPRFSVFTSEKRFAFLRRMAVCLGAVIGVPTLMAQEPPREGKGYTDGPQLPNQVWRVHDKTRPFPPLVTPGAEYGAPPSDAIVLFDGKDLSAFKKAGTDQDAAWVVKDGYIEARGGAGTIETRQPFGDCQLHIEWASPEKPRGEGQGRGNSGVIFMGRYEVQVLDSIRTILTPMGKRLRSMVSFRRRSMRAARRANGRLTISFSNHRDLKVRS